VGRDGEIRIRLHTFLKLLRILGIDPASFFLRVATRGQGRGPSGRAAVVGLVRDEVVEVMIGALERTVEALRGEMERSGTLSGREELSEAETRREMQDLAKQPLLPSPSGSLE